MADYLASIFGTEKDKVNCSFYFKIGACRHGEKCSKVHNKPTFSQTVLLKNLYSNPLNTSQSTDKAMENMNDEQLQQHFDDIFEELFIEMEARYGEIEEMNICDNLSEHLAGNTYVKFRYEEDAEKACGELNNRWFNGKPIYAELSPVTDFHEACCRQYQMGECPRGGFCNFMHLKPISNALRKKLYSVKYSKRGRYDDEGEYEEGYDDYSPTLMSSMGGGGAYYNEVNNGSGHGGHGGHGGGRGGRYGGYDSFRGGRSRSPSPKRRGGDRDRDRDRGSGRHRNGRY